ncbi:hypothetical protein D3C72_1667590 [compost metagenome]
MIFTKITLPKISAPNTGTCAIPYCIPLKPRFSTSITGDNAIQSMMGKHAIGRALVMITNCLLLKTVLKSLQMLLIGFCVRFAF